MGPDAPYVPLVLGTVSKRGAPGSVLEETPDEHCEVGVVVPGLGTREEGLKLREEQRGRVSSSSAEPNGKPRDAHVDGRLALVQGGVIMRPLLRLPRQ